MFYPLVIILTMLIQQPSFKETQLKKTRVKSAYEEKEGVVKSLFGSKQVDYNGFKLFLRAFKKEKQLEVWVMAKNNNEYTLLQTYPFCSSSGTLGPKRKEGDYQIPEGIYHINHFNPESNFHLSLGVSYPNSSDRIFSDKQNPGGAIYVHGNCVTIGCIPITDDKIKELYIIAVEAKNAGQKIIPIHIFPTRLNDFNLNELVAEYGSTHKKFWENLKPVYEDFEKTKTLRSVNVDQLGSYVVSN